MLEQVNAEDLQALEIELLDIVRRWLQDDLILVIMLQAVWVVAIAAIRRTTARLNIGDVPWFWPERAQEGGRIHRAGALFDVVWLQNDAAVVAPILIQR